jgi:S-DNA-T family DNA segregation ATPase FtsK/SpoIIIE
MARMGRLWSGKNRRKGREEAGFLKPETKRAVAGVALLLLSLIAWLSLFRAAGPTGRVVVMGLTRLFGWLGYLLPLLLAVWGSKLLFPEWLLLGRSRWIGLGLLLVGLVGFSHVVAVPLSESLQAALEGRGGGYAGFMISYAVGLALSRVAAGLIFGAAALIGAFLLLNISPLEAWRYVKSFWPSQEQREEEEAAARTAEALPRFRVNTMQTKGEAKPDVVRIQEQQKQEEEKKKRARDIFQSVNRKYKPPSLDLLHSSVGKPDSGNIKENAQKIKRSLEHFGINVAMGEVNVGPTVTQYTLRPEEGVKLSRITALQNDLALALAAHPIRIEAPIPGKNLVGIEIPNKEVSMVRLRDLVAAKEFRRSESPLTFSLGKDVAGLPVFDTLESMPHMLIAGATGAGKSVCINTLLLSLLYRNSPALVRMVLVDPKRVELIAYDGLPHLLTPVIVEAEATINALRWTVGEMERRYRVLSESRARNLLSFNTNNPEAAMPMIVVVIDELADLMMRYAREVEAAIVRLSQMARAVGIHLVLATQRPSVNVITGLVKANIPARIAFHVASQIDSRTILDAAGAEKLLGNGDMLYLSGETAKPRRIQGAFVSEEEVQRVVSAIKEQAGEPNYDEAVVSVAARGGAGGGGGESDDELFAQAKQLVIESGKASASLLQRRLRVGYARAARLLDTLEEDGVISSGEGNRPREVLVQPEPGEKGIGVEEDRW